MSSRVAAIRWLAPVLALALHACAAPPGAEDSDAPAPRGATAIQAPSPATYESALQSWRTPEQMNAWIGEHFEYDMDRALRLSESQRLSEGSLPMHAPAAFYADPRGVCVDLARFAVETLRSIDPALRARYLMIEFDPVSIRGHLLRRHWVASFERDGMLYFFADSKRPGHLAGPYAGTQAFIDDYARYRGRPIIGHRMLASYQREAKAVSSKRRREPD